MQRFYFDHNATTPVCPEALAATVACLSEDYGNASSIHHFGQTARRCLETARWQAAALLGSRTDEIVFTSGGTEADNLAILGAVRASERSMKHVVTLTIEHPAVLAACAQLEREGVGLTRVPVGASGIADPDDIRRAIRRDTVLVSVMHANNELGTVQPVSAVAAIAREAGILFHSDGVQAAGKLPLNAAAMGVDLYAVSGHKFYAPKGVGALYVRKGTRLAQLFHGGRHERDRRPGTENVPGAAALGAAAERAGRDLAVDAARMAALRARLEDAVLSRIPGSYINGALAPRTPNTSNVRFDGIESEALLIALDLRGFAVSSGSACSSGAVEPSHVLLAIGLSREQAKASIRVSMGRANTEAQVDALAGAIEESVAHLRRLSPVAGSHA